MKQGVAYMLLASLFFSFMGGLVKATALHIPFMESVFFRAFISLVLISPWMAWKRVPFFGNNNALLFLRGTSGFTALAISFYVTTKIELALAAILNQTSVFFVALLSGFFLGEKITKKLLAFILLAFAGAIFIVKPSGSLVNVPALLGLMAGFFAAVAYVSIRQLHATDSSFTMVFQFSFYSSLYGFLFGFRSFIWPSPTEWIFLLCIGFCGTVAQLCMTKAYQMGKASEISPYSFASFIFSALWGILIWGEVPDVFSLVGSLLIVAGGIGIMRTKPQKLQR